MKYILPLIILLFSLSAKAKLLNIQECLDLINFQPMDYIEGDLDTTDFYSTIDLRNGYYEAVSKSNENIYCQATKFDNKDGSITLMITGYHYDMVCVRFHTNAFLIFPDGKKYVEMGLEELNLDEKLSDFIDNPDLDVLFEELLVIMRGSYFPEDATVSDLYNELYDYHYILPQQGTTLTVTLRLCDYIPTNEVEIIGNDWDLIQNSIITVELPYDKKFIKFK